MGSESHFSLTAQAGHGSSVVAQAEGLPSPSFEQQQARQFKKKKKLKSAKSAICNKDKGIWSCRHCGWEYPNPQPTAKERREHRRRCSSFRSAHDKVYDWLQKSPATQLEEHGSGEPEGYEDGLLHVEEAMDSRKEDTRESAMVDSVPLGGAQGYQSSDSGGTGREVGPKKDKQLITEEDREENDIGDVGIENGGTEEQSQEEQPAKDYDPQEEQLVASSDSGSQQDREEHDIGEIENGGTEEQSQGSEVEAKHSQEDNDSSSTDSAEKDVGITVVAKGYDPQEEQLVASSDSESQQAKAEDIEESRGKELDGSLSEKNEEKSLSEQVENGVHEEQKSLEEKDGSPVEQLQDFQEENEAVSLGQESGARKKAYHPQEKGPETSGDKQFEPEARQSMKQRIEYVEPKDTAGSSEITPLVENPFDNHLHLPKFLREQRTYDLVCPNCYSCITRRVILRKRKRTAPPARETDQQQKQPKTEEEPLAVSQQEEPPREVEIETEEWQCLACFSVFLTKVRGIRLPRLGGSKETKSEVIEASTSEDACSCIPFLLPNYAWDGDGRATSEDSTIAQQRPVNPNVSSCLPLKLPWSSEEPTEVVENQGEGDRGPPAPSRLDTSAQVPPTTDVGQVHPASEAEASSRREEDQSGFSCAPVLLPAYWNGSEEGVEEDKERGNCLPGFFPHYYGLFEARGDAQVATGANAKWTLNNNCLPMLFTDSGSSTLAQAQGVEKPTQASDNDGKTSMEQNAEQSDIEAVGPEKRYLTTQTRVRGIINTITKLVTVRQKTGGQAASVDSIQVGNENAYVNMKLENQSEALGGNKTDVLLTAAPSTGWALVDALQNEEDAEAALIDSRRPRQPSLSEITEENTQQDQDISKVDDDLTKPLLTHTEQQAGIDTLLAIAQNQAEQQQLKPLSTPEVPTSTNVYVEGPGPGVLLQVDGDDTDQTVHTAVSIAEDVGLIPAEPEASVQGLEILKSIVYGGVDVSLTSLAVVASGAGSDVKTLNLLAMGLANIFAGLIALLHTIGSLWLNDPCAFQERIGRSFWINGGISVVSFLVFGFVAPLVYAFSFRSLDDKDYKFAAAAGASLVCIVLLAIAKARAQSRSYRSTIANLVLTSFVAAVTGFFVGDFLKRWLHKLGLDIGDEAAPPPPPAPPSPFPFFADI